MSFWTDNSAAPSWWHIVLPKTPRFLRTGRAKLPECPYTIRRASVAQAAPLAAFLTAHYGGDDWYLDAEPEWLSTYLRDPTVYVLAAHDAEFNILATIFSTPAGRTYMSHGAILQELRVIEGLCVAPALRSKGVAGQMIAAMDYYTSDNGPVAHIWSRELPYAPPLSTAAQVSTYAYINCKNAQARAAVSRASWEDLQHLWAVHRVRALGGVAAIVLEEPHARRGDLEVWRAVYNDVTHVVVVTHTRRRTRATHEPIYEVVWCGAHIAAATHMKLCLESVAAQYTGLLFVSSVRHGGGADSSWEFPWVYGTSGAHAWYLYNYIPPAFGSCELHAIREEL